MDRPSNKLLLNRMERQQILNRYSIGSESEKELWNNCVFVFDACSLLKLFRLTKERRSNIYEEVFDRIYGRLWIPFQVYHEYLKNRENSIKCHIDEGASSVILKKRLSEMKVDLASMQKSIEQIAIDCGDSNEHPYFPDLNFSEISSSLKRCVDDSKNISQRYKKKFELLVKDLDSLCENDDLTVQIENRFEKGDEFSFEKRLEVVREGEIRFRNKIPPGYGDSADNKKTGTQIYGDLILWKELLDHFQGKDKPVVFITDDLKKGDWCVLDKKGHIKHPREELQKEFHDRVGHDFWMYSLSGFLEKSKDHISANVDPDTLSIFSKNESETAFISFRCDRCKQLHYYKNEDLSLDFECVSSSERQMGAEAQFTSEECFGCDCGNEITIQLSFWEYPLGCHNYSSQEIDGGHDLKCSDYFVSSQSESFYGDYDHDEHVEVCKVCDGNRDGMGNMVEFHKELQLSAPLGVGSKLDLLTQSGSCDWCATLHFKCPRCNTTLDTEFMKYSDGSYAECEGGCGLQFKMETDERGEMERIIVSEVHG
jgi:phage FluMu protein Com